MLRKAEPGRAAGARDQFGGLTDNLRWRRESAKLGRERKPKSSGTGELIEMCPTYPAAIDSVRMGPERTVREFSNPANDVGITCRGFSRPNKLSYRVHANTHIG